MVRSLVRMNGWFFGFFMICRYGDDVTAHFRPIAKLIEQSAQQEMPTQIHGFLTTMIVPIKQPIYMYGCFNVRCIHATFQKVSETKVNTFLSLQFQFQLMNCVNFTDYVCGCFSLFDFKTNRVKWNGVDRILFFST